MAKTVSHKHARQDLRALLEERNHQNAFLRTQLAARIELTASLEARLLSTLDTLDELHASANRDLEQAQRENARLRRKLEAAQAIARDADMEKCDMSNAVLQLVEKVESCNDYSKWRASRIEFSHDINLHPIMPAKSSRAASSSRLAEECTCAHAYSPAIVEELSDALSREKRAHTLTIEEAERRIATLQARLAVRDAEIARRAATCRCYPTSRSPDTSIQLGLMSEEEQGRTAVLAEERNRILESEIGILEDKLERERRSIRGGPLRKAEQSVQTDVVLSPQYRRRGRKSDAISYDEDNDAVPEALSTLDAHIRHLRQSLTDLLKEKDKLRSVLVNELRIQDPGAGVSSAPQRPLTRQKSAGLEGDEKANDAVQSQEDFTDILLLEEECIRLMHSEDNLRAKLQRLQQRETHLNNENARLREEITRLRGTGGDQLSPPSLPPLDTSAIDLNFPPLEPDLVSPACPTLQNGDDGCARPDLTGGAGRTCSSSSTSSTSSPVTPTSLVDPSEVPLPITPTFDDIDGGDDADEITEPIASPSPQEPAPAQTTEPPEDGDRRRDVEVIQSELVDARAEADMREREIAEVRNLMADLAARVGGELHDS